jgi:iron complex transport system substrate-binding protein
MLSLQKCGLRKKNSIISYSQKNAVQLYFVIENDYQFQRGLNIMISKKKILYSISSLIIIAMLAACGNTDNKSSSATSTNAEQTNTSSNNASTTENNSEFRVLTDAAGHEVKVPLHPKRIIAPFMEDPLAALGMKPVAQWGVSGVPQHYLQDKLSGIPVLDMNGGLKPEETLSYSPDLIVFLTEAYTKDKYDEFAKIAPTFVLSDNPDDWRGTLEKLGALMNEESAAQKALTEYDQKLQQAKAQLGNLITTKTAVLLQATEDKSFKLFGPGFYGGGMLYDQLGFKQPALLNGDYESYSMETMPQLDEVDYIFVLSGEGRTKPPVDNPLWQGLAAVKAGHVFEADSGHWFNNNTIANGLMIDDVLKYVHE